MRSVVIVGRPNVGKSSLFNRLTGYRDAVVASESGSTRDLKQAVVEADDRLIQLTDTGGLWSGDDWEVKILAKVDQALSAADLVLFLVDGRSELTEADFEIAEYLRKSRRPVLLVATKVDAPGHEAWLGGLYTLGFGRPMATSVEHRRGLDELLEMISGLLPADDGAEQPEPQAIRVAIIGRPNAGKSSLLNAIVGEERVIVAEQPGTTRDAIDQPIEVNGKNYVLVDTAGIRKRPETAVEHFAIARAHRVIRMADVVLLVIDPFEIGDRELKLATEVSTAGKPTLLVVSKWDLVPKDEASTLMGEIRERLAHLHNLHMLTTSSVLGVNIQKMFSEVTWLYRRSYVRYDTAGLNRLVRSWVARTRLPNFKGRPLKIYYLTQPEVAPPTFVFFVNHPEFVTRAFEGYLRNRIAADLDLAYIPFRMKFKARKGSVD